MNKSALHNMYVVNPRFHSILEGCSIREYLQGRMCITNRALLELESVMDNASPMCTPSQIPCCIGDASWP